MAGRVIGRSVANEGKPERVHPSVDFGQNGQQGHLAGCGLLADRPAVFAFQPVRGRLVDLDDRGAVE